MKSVNWWAVFAGMGLVLILALAVGHVFHPGEKIVIPEAIGDGLVPVTEVYVTPGGAKYHREDCASLKESSEIWKLTPDAAEADDYEACLRCKPR